MCAVIFQQNNFQGENAKFFPFQKQTRPSSLPLPVVRHNKKDEKLVNPELRQFAGSLVDGVIKTVSESNADELCAQMMEATVSDYSKQQENVLDAEDEVVD